MAVTSEINNDSVIWQRQSIGQVHKIRLLAILPVLVAAVVNTGHQYLASAAEVDERIAIGIVNSTLQGLIIILPVLAIALIASAFWERLFAENRERPFDIGVIYTALIFTMLMPPDCDLLHVVFGLSFAMVFAHGIFGGEGRTFLNPALVAVAVVQISFPGNLSADGFWDALNGYAGSRYLQDYHQQGGLLNVDWMQAFTGNLQGQIGVTSVLSISVSASILIITRMISWQLVFAQIIGLIAMAMIYQYFWQGVLDVPWHWHLVLGSFAFVVVFVASDPSASASTKCGRWIQGLLSGVLVVLLRALDPAHADSVVPVVLLVSLMTPLIDHVVIWFNIRQRSGRV